LPSHTPDYKVNFKINNPVLIVRIFASQKPGYPLQFLETAAVSAGFPLLSLAPRGLTFAALTVHSLWFSQFKTTSYTVPAIREAGSCIFNPPPIFQ
jgi:hypothetical protein